MWLSHPLLPLHTLLSITRSTDSRFQTLAMWAVCELLNLPEYSMSFTLWLTQVKYGGKTPTWMTGYHSQAFRVSLWKTHGSGNVLASGFLEVKPSSGQGKASTALLRGAAWVWAGPPLGHLLLCFLPFRCQDEELSGSQVLSR